MDRADPAYRGQRDYTRLLLRLYDPLVLGPITKHVWRCPSERLEAGYRQRVRPPHLDVGPGTGYFLARSGLPDGSRVTLVDPNRNVLEYVSRRLVHLDVKTVEADVCKPLPLANRYASAALNLVIHCLPGPTERKAEAVAHVAAVLEPDGVLFGSSVLGESGRHPRIARQMLNFYNRRGAFDNLHDTEETLHAMLAKSFERVQIEVIGSIAVFAAHGPRAA